MVTSARLSSKWGVQYEDYVILQMPRHLLSIGVDSPPEGHAGNGHSRVRQNDRWG